MLTRRQLEILCQTLDILDGIDEDDEEIVLLKLHNPELYRCLVSLRQTMLDAK